MATYKYPTRDLDKPDNLVALLGSFWAAIYHGNATVRNFASARGQLEAQTDQLLQEAVDSVSRLKVPIYHTDLWYQLTLRESLLNEDKVALHQYGDAITYGDGTVYGKAPGRALFSWALPADLMGAPLIFNRLQDPSLSLLDGLDYVLDLPDRAIRFRENPFLNDLVPRRPVYDDQGTVVDREIALWVFRAQWDWKHIHQHFGHVLGLDMTSSRSYRRLVNAIWDGIVQGGHYNSILEAFAAIADVELSRGDETVEVIIEDNNYQLVITDKHVYKFNFNAEVVVSVGEQLRAGDSLVDAVTLHEFNRGEVPADLGALTLGKGYLIGGYYGGVTFHDKEVVPTVTENVDGKTRIEFEVGGLPGDVTKFWNDMHERGVAEGQTLANLLDVRANPAGEPTAASLPATINPLKFLIENVLRDNVFLVRMKLRSFGPEALSTSHTRQLRRIIPPHTAFIVLVELAADTDTITMDGTGDETDAGYEEELLFALTMDWEEALDPPSYVAEEVTFTRIGGVCV